jgi:hypothetical protein
MNHEEDKETQTWLAILSGETVAGADPSLVFEAEALRAVLQCRLHPPQLNPNILDKVIVQLQKEGLLKPNPGWIDWLRGRFPKGIRFPSKTPQWSWQWKTGLSFAFSLLIAVIILPPFLKSPAPELTNRGTSPYCVLSDANPQTRVAQLQTELAKIGVSKTTLTTRGSTQRIDVDVTGLSSSNAAELEVFLKKQNCQGGWTTGSTLQAIIITPANH